MIRVDKMHSETNTPSLQDSVVTGDLHQGNVIHNHYHFHNHDKADNHEQQTIQTQAISNPNPTVTQGLVQSTIPVPMKKDVFLAYVLWLVAGIFGAHRFYLGKTGSGLAFVFTFGFFGIGWLVDAGLIPNMVHEANYPNGGYIQQTYQTTSVGVV